MAWSDDAVVVVVVALGVRGSVSCVAVVVDRKRCTKSGYDILDSALALAAATAVFLSPFSPLVAADGVVTNRAFNEELITIS